MQSEAHPLPLGFVAEFLANLETNSRQVMPDANGHLPGDAVCEVQGAPEPAADECVPGGSRRFVGDVRTIPPTPLDNEDGSPTPSKLVIQDTLGEQQPYLDEIRQLLVEINVPWFAPGAALTAEILERHIPNWLFDNARTPRELTLEMSLSEVADQIKCSIVGDNEFVDSDFSEPMQKSNAALLLGVAVATVTQWIKKRKVRVHPASNSRTIRVHVDDFQKTKRTDIDKKLLRNGEGRQKLLNDLK